LVRSLEKTKAGSFSLSGGDFEHDSVIKLGIITREMLIIAVLVRPLRNQTITTVSLASFKLLYPLHLGYVLAVKLIIGWVTMPIKVELLDVCHRFDC